MSVAVLFTGPEDEKEVRVNLPGYPLFMERFRKWKESKIIPDHIAAFLLKQPGFIEKGFSLDVWLQDNPKESVIIRRHAALGDVLQLIISLYDKPELLKRIRIETQSRYQPIVDTFWRSEVDPKKMPTGVILNYDGLAELDHTEEYFRKLHRIDIFREAIGLFNFKNTFPEYLHQDKSWYWENATICVPEEPYLVINKRGSRDDNTIELETLLETVARLREHHRVILLTEDMDHPDNYSDQMEYPDFFKLVANARKVVVTDSGLLWVAHFTKTSVIGMLRHTTFETRLKYALNDPLLLDLQELASKSEEKDPKFVYSGDPELLFKAIVGQL